MKRTIICTVFLILCALTGLVLTACTTANTSLYKQEDSAIIPADDGQDIKQEKDGMSLLGLSVMLRNVAESSSQPGGGSHTAVGQLSGFFTTPINYGSARISLFAFVRVLDANRWDTHDTLFTTGQKSTLQIILPIWNCGNVEIPEIITIEQAARVNTDPILLSEGAVYLLPLTHSNWNGNDTWHIRSPYTVLFEVDDTGRIWSHSPFESFNRFDGKDASVVVDEIIAITSDENFSAAADTGFGTWASWEWDSLVETTVLSAVRIDEPGDGWGGTFHYEITLYIDYG